MVINGIEVSVCHGGKKKKKPVTQVNIETSDYILKFFGMSGGFVPVAAHGSDQQSRPRVLHFLQLRTDHFLPGGCVAPQGQLTLAHHHV